jgi:hypothetical protein
MAVADELYDVAVGLCAPGDLLDCRWAGGKTPSGAAWEVVEIRDGGNVCVDPYSPEGTYGRMTWVPACCKFYTRLARASEVWMSRHRMMILFDDTFGVGR